jgi:hypothetical protein
LTFPPKSLREIAEPNDGALRQPPADEQEISLWSKFAQDLHKIRAEAVTGKERVPAIGTGGQKLQLAGLEVAWIKGHRYEISTRGLQQINRLAGLCASQSIGSSPVATWWNEAAKGTGAK